jgi:hypothetical protein
VANDDDILSVTDGWRLHLEERFGDKLSDREKREIARHYTRLKLAPRDLEEKREAIKRVRDCKDIVHGWDDPNDFSWWKDAFKILKPPSAREVDGGNGDD